MDLIFYRILSCAAAVQFNMEVIPGKLKIPMLAPTYFLSNIQWAAFTLLLNKKFSLFKFSKSDLVPGPGGARGFAERQTCAPVWKTAPDGLSFL
jgi:hypothetical protein